MSIFNRSKKTGLALGGGAVLGAAHIGVLRALEELNIKIDYIAGTSIGAFVASFYAFNRKWEEIREFALDLDWFDLSGVSLSQYALLSNKKMGEKLRETLGDVNIEDSEIPLAIMATDIRSGEKVILKSGNLAEAVMASTCIPGIFIPIEHDDSYLVDGGIVENVPISPLKQFKADRIIAVRLHSGPERKKPENIVEVLLNMFTIFIGTITEYQLKEADLVITPELSRYNLVEIKQVPELIEDGYRAAMEVLEAEPHR